MIRKLKKEIKYWIPYLLGRLLPDKSFLVLKGFIQTGKWPNLDNPRTINDKLRWLMLNNRDERLHMLADKCRVREYVRQTIGEEYLIELLDVYESVEEIRFETLPETFVLKTNHGSGWNVVCLDQDDFDVHRAKKKLNRWLRRNYYDHTKEWAYKGIKPLILRERFLNSPEQGRLPRDYKIHCFWGKPRFIQVYEDMDAELKRNIYDCEWNPSHITEGLPPCRRQVRKPEKLAEMLEVASKLSKDIPYVRVDLYYVDQRIYFGEMTFYHDAAGSRYITREMEEEIGSWLDLGKLKATS